MQIMHVEECVSLMYKLSRYIQIHFWLGAWNKVIKPNN